MTTKLTNLDHEAINLGVEADGAEQSLLHELLAAMGCRSKMEAEIRSQWIAARLVRACCSPDRAYAVRTSAAIFVELQAVVAAGRRRTTEDPREGQE